MEASIGLEDLAKEFITYDHFLELRVPRPKQTPAHVLIIYKMARLQGRRPRQHREPHKHARRIDDACL